MESSAAAAKSLISGFKTQMIAIVNEFSFSVIAMYLDNDNFLNELNKLFASTREKGSLFITLKKYDGHTKPIPRNTPKGVTGAAATRETPIQSCLIRAQTNKDKISTVVHAKDVNKFHLQFGTILKANMDGLKKATKPTKAKAVP